MCNKHFQSCTFLPVDRYCHVLSLWTTASPHTAGPFAPAKRYSPTSRPRRMTGGYEYASYENTLLYAIRLHSAVVRSAAASNNPRHFSSRHDCFLFLAGPLSVNPSALRFRQVFSNGKFKRFKKHHGLRRHLCLGRATWSLE